MGSRIKIKESLAARAVAGLPKLAGRGLINLPLTVLRARSERRSGQTRELTWSLCEKKIVKMRECASMRGSGAEGLGLAQGAPCAGGVRRYLDLFSFITMGLNRRAPYLCQFPRPRLRAESTRLSFEYSRPFAMQPVGMDCGSGNSIVERRVFLFVYLLISAGLFGTMVSYGEAEAARRIARWTGFG